MKTLSINFLLRPIRAEIYKTYDSTFGALKYKPKMFQLCLFLMLQKYYHMYLSTYKFQQKTDR